MLTIGFLASFSPYRAFLSFRIIFSWFFQSICRVVCLCRYCHLYICLWVRLRKIDKCSVQLMYFGDCQHGSNWYPWYNGLNVSTNNLSQMCVLIYCSFCQDYIIINCLYLASLLDVQLWAIFSQILLSTRVHNSYEHRLFELIFIRLLYNFFVVVYFVFGLST